MVITTDDSIRAMSGEARPSVPRTPTTLCPSVRLPACLFLRLFIFLFPFVFSVFLFLHLSFMFLSQLSYIRLSIYQPKDLIFLYIYLFHYDSVFLSLLFFFLRDCQVCVSVYQSEYLSKRLHLSVSVCIPTQLSFNLLTFFCIDFFVCLAQHYSFVYPIRFENHFFPLFFFPVPLLVSCHFLRA